MREVDSRYAWFRLGVCVLLCALGGVGWWSVVVALPAVQAEFGSGRGEASLPFTLFTIGFGVGGMVMGRLSDRIGVVIPVMIGAVSLVLGYALASLSTGLSQFAAAEGVFIGLFGSAATFAPLIADISKWFERRRGIAVALCASGNYIAGALWPPVVEMLIRTQGWRTAHQWIALACGLTMLPLALLLRAPAPVRSATAPVWTAVFPRVTNLTPGTLQVLLVAAGVFCCLAMAMPQVHLVAYCADLGYGAAAGARMLAVMLAFGAVSRITFGFIADKLGGLMTLTIGSAAQMAALTLYLTSDGLMPLFVISAMFGLFQGGIVPSYAIVVRESFPVREAGIRIGVIMMANQVGMALGGWVSGMIFDMTGSYRAAFGNGVLWNVLNLAIVAFLLTRGRQRSALAF